jgi:hypothetical protein
MASAIIRLRNQQADVVCMHAVGEHHAAARHDAVPAGDDEPGTAKRAAAQDAAEAVIRSLPAALG